MFASIIFHELAHAIVARHYEIKISGITLFIFGGVAELQDEPPTPKSEFLVAIAGPISSYLLAASFLLFGEILPLGTPQEVFGLILFLMQINVVLATFNLVPAFPLDGGRMLRAAIWWIKGSLRQATKIASILGSVLGVALMTFGAYNSFYGSPVSGMWQILIGFFILNAAGNAQRQMEVLEVLRGVTVGQLMRAPPSAIPGDVSIDQIFQHPELRGRAVFLPVSDHGNLIGFIRPLDLENIPAQTRRTTLARDAASPLKEPEILSPSQNAVGAMAQLQRARGYQAYVMADGQIVGWIEARDILAYLNRHSPDRKTDEPHRAAN
jgi:Zn-dependent protease